VGLRFADGVVMAATAGRAEGHSIAHPRHGEGLPRRPALSRRHRRGGRSAVEMVRLFQVQLRSTTRVEGVALSLEGKANQLAQMCGASAYAMQGLARRAAVLRYDLAAASGASHLRRDRRPLRGSDFQAPVGRARRPHHDQARLRDGLTRDEGIELAVEAPLRGGHETSATGGPDLVRGIYPLVAVVDETGLPGRGGRRWPSASRVDRATARPSGRSAEG